MTGAGCGHSQDVGRDRRMSVTLAEWLGQVNAPAGYPFFSIFAHVSLSDTARLKIGWPGFESLSTQK